MEHGILAVRAGEKEIAMFFVILALFVVFGSLLTIITVQNLETSVSLSVFAWHSPMLPLGLVVVFSFVLGALLLYLVSLLSAWRDGRQIKKLRQRIAQLEQAATGSVVAAPLPGGGITAMPMPALPPDSVQPPQPQG
jgi:uncharacterized integral membrane protein